jgi:hypothetical protein
MGSEGEVVKVVWNYNLQYVKTKTSNSIEVVVNNYGRELLWFFLIEHLPIERRLAKVKENKEIILLQDFNWKTNTF